MSLPPTCIGIDVETTSLDPTAGDIIDVAAIRYDLKTGQEVGRFEALAAPTEPISEEISALTGITQEMVADKPPFAEHVAALQEFIGDETLFAHNASFDVKWLTQHGLTIENPVWDTFALAGFAWPESPSYNLGFLLKQQGITPDGEHRAAADVVMTWKLLAAIREQLTVSPATHARITELCQAAKLSQYLPLFTARQTQSKQKEPATAAAIADNPPLPELAELFATDGLLVQNIPGFEPRPAQQQLAEHITKTLTNHETTVIEAPTGSGKTYAYLLPALKAQTKDNPIIISTHTRHLQDQLFEKDIPRLLAAVGSSLRTAVLKGRRNYICQTRLEKVLTRATQSPADALLLIKVLLWLDGGASGDLERLNASHQDTQVLRHIHADAISCRLTCTPHSGCPYQIARVQAQQADIVIVNHALLAQLVNGEEQYLPLKRVIIDEAHHVPDTARQADRRDLSPQRVSEAVAPIVQIAQQHLNEQRAQHITAESEALVREYSQFIYACGQLVQNHSSDTVLRLTPVVRRGRDWQAQVASLEAWRSRLKFLSGLAHSALDDLPRKEQAPVREAIKELTEIAHDNESFMVGAATRVQWIEVRESYATPGSVVVTLHDIAVAAHEVVAPLFTAADSVILISATLTTNANFSYIKRELGIESATEYRAEPTFEYAKNMLVYVVNDGPEPNSTRYDTHVADLLNSVTELLSGRTLGLFTSHKSVKATYYKLLKKLNKDTIKLYAQRLTGGRKNILDRFRENPHSVLLGTMSFWEGVDVPGDSLSAVVIPRLPFPNPRDPLLEAISEYEAARTQGKYDSFNELTIPRTILRLQQGIGRLLRSSTDRGVIVITDPRLSRSRYGQDILKSLPPATIQVGPHRDLVPTLTDWFTTDLLTQWEEQATTPAKKDRPTTT